MRGLLDLSAMAASDETPSGINTPIPTWMAELLDIGRKDFPLMNDAIAFKAVWHLEICTPLLSDVHRLTSDKWGVQLTPPCCHTAEGINCRREGKRPWAKRASSIGFGSG